MRLFGWVGRRLSTSLMYAQGSCPFIRADWIKLITAAAPLPARRLPANSQFDLPPVDVPTKSGSPGSVDEFDWGMGFVTHAGLLICHRMKSTFFSAVNPVCKGTIRSNSLIHSFPSGDSRKSAYQATIDW